MIQQINLYQPAMLEKKQSFPLTMMMGLFGLGVVLIAAYYASVAWQTRIFEVRLKALENRQTALLTQMTALQQAPEVRKSPLLQHEVDSLSRELAAKQPLLDLFKAPVTAASTGFSGYLEGLSRRTPDGLWLSHITLASAAGRSALEGSALDAEKVPAFLQALKDEPAFVGMAFSGFSLAQEESGGHVIDFRLETRKESTP